MYVHPGTSHLQKIEARFSIQQKKAYNPTHVSINLKQFYHATNIEKAITETQYNSDFKRHHVTNSKSSHRYPKGPKRKVICTQNPCDNTWLTLQHYIHI